MTLRGSGEPADLAMVHMLKVKACEGGVRLACVEAGDDLLAGRGVVRDRAAAAARFEAALQIDPGFSAARQGLAQAR